MASEYANLPGYSAWLRNNPEPVCSQGALQPEYDEWLRRHGEWGKRRGAFFERHKRPAPAPDAEPEYSPPDPLSEEAAAPFPRGVLPPELQRWVEAVAVFNQVPPTMPATFALMAAMTAAIDKNVQIRPGWVEPCVGQLLLIASPSERKSPVFGAAFAPIY